MPCTLAMMIDDEVLAKAFWVIAIITRPGARNCRYASFCWGSVVWPSASAKIARNSSVVTTGATIVWL